MIVSGRHVPAEEAKQARHHRRARAGGRTARRRRSPLRAGSPTCGRCRASATATRSSPRARPAMFDGDAQVDRPPRPQPARALCLHRGGRGGLHAAVRRGLRARAQAVRRAGRFRRGAGAALCVLRRARGGEDARSSRPTRQLRPTDNPAVVGAGTMGGGIAMSFADYGFDVKIMDATRRRSTAAWRGSAPITKPASSAAAWPQDEMERRFARIHPVASYRRHRRLRRRDRGGVRADRRQGGGLRRSSTR